MKEVVKDLFLGDSRDALDKEKLQASSINVIICSSLGTLTVSRVYIAW
jgi:hypothetical protein